MLYHRGMPDETENPFMPGAGKTPPILVGHKRVTRRLRNMLKRTLAKKSGDMAVLYGPRGNGKTTLLKELGMWAKTGGAEIRIRTGGQLAGPPETAARVLQDDSVKHTEYAKSVDVNLAFAKAGIAESSTSTYSFFGVLRDMAHSKPAVVLVDEAHMLSPESGRELLNAAQRCVSDGLQLLLVLAGTPHIQWAIGRMDASFWERLESLKIGRLESDDEVREALSVPASQTGLPFDDDALNLLVQESQRYPFFVQLLGWSAWDIAQQEGHDRITLEDAEKGVREANSRRGEFYSRRLEEARTQGLLSEAVAVSKELVTRGDIQSIHERDMGKLLELLAAKRDSTPSEILEGLVELGLVWQEEPLLWEAGIPSLCQFLADSFD